MFVRNLNHMTLLCFYCKDTYKLKTGINLPVERKDFSLLFL